MEISQCGIIIVIVTVLEMQVGRGEVSLKLSPLTLKNVCTSVSLLDSFAKFQVDKPANVTQTRFLLHV